MLDSNTSEQIRQHLGTGDMRIVAGVDFISAPAFAFGTLIKRPEAVVGRIAAAIDELTRQCERAALQRQFLFERLDRLRQPQRLAPGAVLRGRIGRHRPGWNPPAVGAAAGAGLTLRPRKTAPGAS